MDEPAYSFTIPSLASDTPLDCRIYHPTDLEAILANAAENKHATRGAAVAHPYAPLGGSYDDSVVLAVVRCLLKEGYVVGTFNFRGAQNSKGSTSWTGRPEREDYTSFAGFMVYYLQQLQPVDDSRRLSTIPSARTSHVEGAEPSVPGTTAANLRANSQSSDITLLLSGYSYGSLILSRLLPMPEILSRFESAHIGTTPAEILLRARRLAQESRSTMTTAHSSPEPRGRRLTPSDATKPRLRASPVVVGGEETNPQERRRSRETSRSASIVHRSVEMPHRIKARIRRRSSEARSNAAMRSEESIASSQATRSAPGVSVRYLLISPLLPPLAHTLVAPASLSSLRGGVDRSTGFGMMNRPTLAVWGSEDGFTSNRRLKAWAERMTGSGHATGVLKWKDVQGAGHFWREPGAMKALMQEIRGWVK